MLGIPALQFLSPEVGGECECASVCVSLRSGRDIHLGHGYEVAIWGRRSLLCASPHPQELRFLSSFSREQAKAREGQGRAQGPWAGSEWSKWLEVETRPPRSESRALHFPTLQDRLSEDLLGVALKARARPNGVVVPGYGFRGIYPFSTLVECLLRARIHARHW